MKIDERLLNDSIKIKDLNLCELRLLKDGELDWFILIPKVDNCSELYDLTQDEQYLLMDEINYVTQALKEHSIFDKLNIAAIGNIVSQMHVHIIARKKTDRAWPGPIWGTNSVKDFSPKRADFWDDKLRLRR